MHGFKHSLAERLTFSSHYYFFGCPSSNASFLRSDFQRDTGFIGDVLSHEMGINPEHGFPDLRTVIYSPDIVSDAQVRYHKVDLNQVIPLLSPTGIQSLDVSLPSLEIK